jgi:hypothetical protein
LVRYYWLTDDFGQGRDSSDSPQTSGGTHAIEVLNLAHALVSDAIVASDRLEGFPSVSPSDDAASAPMSLRRSERLTTTWLWHAITYLLSPREDSSEVI